MRVEIIENNANHFGMRIALVYEPLHLLRKVVLGSPLRHGPCHVASSGSASGTRPRLTPPDISWLASVLPPHDGHLTLTR